MLRPLPYSRIKRNHVRTQRASRMHLQRLTSGLVADCYLLHSGLIKDSLMHEVWYLSIKKIAGVETHYKKVSIVESCNVCTCTRLVDLGYPICAVCGMRRYV